MQFEKGFKLFDDTYLCLFDKFIAIVKVDENGKIIRVRTFGNDTD